MRNERYKYPHATQCSMKEILELAQEEERVSSICAKYGLNPEILWQFLDLRLKGCCNAEVAQKLGIHRVTVQRYIGAFKKMEESETGIIKKYWVNKGKEIDNDN